MDRLAPDVSAGSRPMWCPKCESEVATEVAADGQSLLCVSCGSRVRQLTAPSLHPDIRRAREILNRLSSATSPKPADDEPADALDEPVELDDVIAAHVSEEEDNALAERVPASRPKQIRIDRPHPVADVARTHVGAESEKPASPTKMRSERSDEPHAALPAPHFDVQPARPLSSPGRGESAWGQLMAYLGVAVLTVGTALVVWGYLGGPPTYAPTGWLVATAGQMLLLLGIITLVAGGMQHTTHEVSSRVAHLNGRVIRMEQTANELLRGPHFGGAARRAASGAEIAQDAESGQS